MRKQFIKDHRPHAFYSLFYMDFLVMVVFFPLFLNFGAISQTFEKIGPELGERKMKFKNPKSVN